MEQRICKQCGKAYVYHGHGSGDHTKYCSDDCFAEVKRKANLRTYHKNHKGWKPNPVAMRRVLESEEKRRQWLRNSVPDGFEYLGDWTGGNTKVSLKCLKHGEVVSRNIDTLRSSSGIRCKICRAEYLREYGKKRTVYGSREGYLAEVARQKEEREQAKHESRKRIVVCDVCGKQFITYNPQQKRCSTECAKAHKRGKQPSKNHRKRIRMYGGEYDRSVTLKRLIERDGLRCKICGEMCDTNDHRWSKWFGPLYPTLDHVIPLSKGGGHTWDNVQVAHAICNSTKRDIIEATPQKLA